MGFTSADFRSIESRQEKSSCVRFHKSRSRLALPEKRMSLEKGSIQVEQADPRRVQLETKRL